MPSDLKNSLYDVVEIIDGNNESSKVLFLERVDGFTIIFKAPQRQRCVEITENEFPRFSHQILAVRGEMNAAYGTLILHQFQVLHLAKEDGSLDVMVLLAGT